MKSQKLTVDIASPPDRKRLVAMLLINNEQWAEINQESDKLTLELYPRQDGKPWVIDFDDAIQMLHTGKKRLSG